jgi:hypothetical protein
LRHQPTVLLAYCAYPISTLAGLNGWLDLKNFHQASHHAPILPVLIATDADSSDETWKPPHADDVRPPIRCNADDLGRVLQHGLILVSGAKIDEEAWGAAPYHPTPTIIEEAPPADDGRAPGEAPCEATTRGSRHPRTGRQDRSDPRQLRQ